MNKSKKIILRQTYNTWNEVPFVIIAELVKKQQWITNLSIRYNVEQSIFTPMTFPTHVLLKGTFEEQPYEIAVSWSPQYNTIGTCLYQPPTETYKNDREFYSKTYEKILKRIHDAVSTAEIECGRIATSKKEEKKLEEKRKANMKDVKQQIVTSPLKMNEEIGMAAFNYNGSHRLYFFISSNDASVYRVTMEGCYTIDEIKKMVEVISSGPSYAVERLTSKKEMNQ